MDEDMTYTAHRSPGRRSTDSWAYFGKVIGIIIAVIALLGSIGKVFVAGAQVQSNTAAIAAVSERVTLLERYQVDGHYMTCFLFRKENPDGLPASCDIALSRGR